MLSVYVSMCIILRMCSGRSYHVYIGAVRQSYLLCDNLHKPFRVRDIILATRWYELMASPPRPVPPVGAPAPAAITSGKVLGQLHEFRPDEERFTVYLERVKIFFAVNDVPPEKKVPVFLNAVGGRTYGVLRNLVAPDNPIDKSFEEIEGKLTDHYDPRPLVIAERYHFHKREQAAGESVVQYLEELRRLAGRCNFGGYLDEALRDRFVCGLKNDHIQKGLLAEADLNLGKAIKRATAMEAAQKHTQVLKASPPLVVGAVTQQQSIQAQLPQSAHSGVRGCYRCGNAGHRASECHFRNSACHKCGKLGHISRVCRAASANRGGGRGRRYTPQRPAANQIEVDPGEELQESVDELILSVNTVGKGVVRPYVAILEVNGKPIKMEVDTGAAVSLISQSTLESLFPGAVLQPPTLKLHTYTTEKIRVLGQMEVRVKHKNFEGTHTLYVVQGAGPSLLGRNWLSNIQLDGAKIKHVHAQEVKEVVGRLMDKYSEVFRTKPGVMTKHRARLNLKQGAPPISRRAQTVSFAMKKKIGQELDRLEENGILRRVDYADWAAPIVPVVKSDGSLRICSFKH